MLTSNSLARTTQLPFLQRECWLLILAFAQSAAAVIGFCILVIFFVIVALLKKQQRKRQKEANKNAQKSTVRSAGKEKTNDDDDVYRQKLVRAGEQDTQDQQIHPLGVAFSATETDRVDGAVTGR